MLGNSASMVRRLIEGLDIKRARTVVELGSGTGAITKEVAKRLPPDATFLAFESNADLAGRLKQMASLKNVRVIEDDAGNLDDYVSPGEADCVISGLPLLNMRKSAIEKIIKKSSDSLRPGGMFIAYQLTLIHRKMLEKYFSILNIERVWRNFPPYRVITCRKSKSD